MGKYLFLVNLLMSLTIDFATGAEMHLKKIVVSDTNNAPYFNRSSDYIHEELKPAYLKKLKSYLATTDFKPNEGHELEQITAAMAWVTKQWVHNGMNQPPGHFRGLDILKKVHQKKIQYRCVEYSLVLSDILQAFGFVTRSVALRSKNVAYGGFGQGHVAIEVWINDLNKWAFFDPQFGTYLTDQKQLLPLSFYEAFIMKEQNRWPSLEVRFVHSPKDPKKESLDYKKFVAEYFGHMTVSSGRNSPRISLKLGSAETSLTFQGMASNNQVFTNDHKDIYPEMNRATILLNYKDEDRNFQEKMTSLNIQSNEDYLANMPKFAAKPHFLVRVMPTQNYEYRRGNEKWKKNKKPEFDWNATETENRLEVRLINQYGRPGPITFMNISYR